MSLNHQENIPASFFFRRFYSFTGVFSLGLFIFWYIYSNAKALGPNGVQSFNDFQKSLTDVPFLPLLEFFLVFVPLTFHIFYSFFLFYRGQNNLWHYPYSGNLKYTLHRTAGVLGFLFLAYHFFFVQLDAIFSDAPTDYLSRVHLFEAPDGVVATLIGGTALFYYFASNLAQSLFTWGITVSVESQQKIYRWCLVLFIILALINFAVVMNYFYNYEKPPAWIGFFIRASKILLFQ
jgi:succinate dehydrogenase / fumarate reductase cytochrome b subunit